MMIQVSVIIPVFRQVGALPGCLQALRSQAQDSPGIFEVILLDAAPRSRLEKLEENDLPFPLRICNSHSLSLPAALNQAVQAARGQYCLFLPEEFNAGPHLVSQHLQAQQSGSGIIGSGVVERRLPAAQPGEAQASPCWLECTIEHLSLPREALLNAGGFDEGLPLGCDIELAYRQSGHGMPCLCLPNATIRVDEPRGASELVSQAQKRGAAYAAIWRRHPETLPVLLGHYHDAGLRAVLLRRILLGLHVPPALLRWFSLPFKLAGRRFQWLEFLQDYSFWQGVRGAVQDAETWRRLIYGVPVLIYHAFAGAGAPSSRYILAGSKFRRQMSWLKRLGFRVIRLEDYIRCLREARLPPERSVLITMDDGYQDNYEIAYPVLRKFGFPATIFLIGSRMGAANDWDEGSALSGRPTLSWSQAREMLQGGISFGAHTQTHPFLSQTTGEEAWREIAGSKQVIERELGAPAALFAYPHGVYRPADQAMVEQAGFQGACTVQVGLNTPSTPPFALRRREIKGTYSLLKFFLLLWTG